MLLQETSSTASLVINVIKYTVLLKISSELYPTICTLIICLNVFQNASPSSYYAIFDGHAGHDAAAYSSAHLHQFLAESKHFVDNPEQALIDAFCKTDALFIDKCRVEVSCS